MRSVSKHASWGWIDATLLASILAIAAIVVSVLASGFAR